MRSRYTAFVVTSCASTRLRYCTRGIQSSSNTASKRVCPLLGKMRQPREGSRLGTLKPEKRLAFSQSIFHQHILAEHLH
ncbi:hypothetical protein GBAR_LOCUS20509 [Geodia barretti]|uniref:Uncharacterized protein n=1 Tax=Geodia barretti TaxID=519541 RepID=A0AA35WWN7_GEOBA|nr:hypothetical protein GBAR_LOCUS20509 [Geodia barretti]